MGTLPSAEFVGVGRVGDAVGNCVLRARSPTERDADLLANHQEAGGEAEGCLNEKGGIEVRRGSAAADRTRLQSAKSVGSTGQVKERRRRCVGGQRDQAKGEREEKTELHVSSPRPGSASRSGLRTAAHVAASSPVACDAERRANCTKCNEALLSGGCRGRGREER